MEQEKVPELSQKDMEKLIKGILKELEKGTTVASMGKEISGFKGVCGTGMQDFCNSPGSDRPWDHG